MNKSKFSETIDVISNRMNSSRLGIEFEKNENEITNNDLAEEEPQEIFSDSEEDNKKMYSIDYEKVSNEENKNHSIDESKMKR